MGKSHGRQEKRTLTSTTGLNHFLTQQGWPGVRQVFRVVREVTVRGKTTREVAYGITSLPRERADAAVLLRLNRGHWGIENRVFYVRDVTFGEDRCRLRTRHSPHNLATIRNFAITWLRRQGVDNIAAALRSFAWNPQPLFASLGIFNH